MERKIAGDVKDNFHLQDAKIFFKSPDPKDPSSAYLDLKKDEASKANFQWAAFQVLLSVDQNDDEPKYYIYSIELNSNGTEKPGAKVFESDSNWSGKNKDIRAKDLTPAEVKVKFPGVLRGPVIDPVKLEKNDVQAVYVNIDTNKSYSSKNFSKFFDNDYFVVLDPTSKELKNPLGKSIGTKGEEKIMNAEDLYSQAVKTAFDRSKPYSGGFSIMKNLVKDLRKEQKTKKKESLLAPIIESDSKK